MYLYVLSEDWFPESLTTKTDSKATHEWRRNFRSNDATLLQEEFPFAGTKQYEE